MSKHKIEVLKGTHVTEKSTNLSSLNQYVFKVHPQADKLQIKVAVEEQYKVKVVQVNLVNLKGKMRRFGKTLGRRSDWKKAYVALAEGETIKFPEIEAPKEA